MLGEVQLQARSGLVVGKKAAAGQVAASDDDDRDSLAVDDVQLRVKSARFGIIEDEFFIKIADCSIQALDARTALVDSKQDAGGAASGPEPLDQGPDAREPALSLAQATTAVNSPNLSSVSACLRTV